MAATAGYDQRRIMPLILTVCLQSSRLRSALDHAEPYLLQHPKEQTLRFLVATIHLSLGHIDAAKIRLEELLRTNGQNPDAQYLLGILAMDSAPSEATEHFNKYLALSPRGDRSAEAQSRLTELDVRLARLRQTPAPVRALSTTTNQQDSIESGLFSDSGASAPTSWFEGVSVHSTIAQSNSH
jgi:tetratricopeptide (TPR) repeat protein